MKKLIVIAMVATGLSVFNACQKDELIDPKVDLHANEVINSNVCVENGYLVLKDFETADSLKNILVNESLWKQKLWEGKLGFKSAKTYRAEVSKKLEGMVDIPKAEKYISDLMVEGYFSMKDSSITYPFYNYSWSCILSPGGIIQIDNVIYLFNEDSQVAVLNGDYQLLNKFERNLISKDDENINIRKFNHLKSVTPTYFQNITSTSRQVTYNYTYKLGITLKYSPITRYDYFYHDDVQEGVTYDLYYHQQRKQNWWWIDKPTKFYEKRNSHDIGGNYDSLEGAYYNRITQTTAGSWYQLNTSDLANYHLEVFSAWHNVVPFYYPVFSSYTGPTIYNFNSSGYSDKVGSTSDPITTIVN